MRNHWRMKSYKERKLRKLKKNISWLFTFKNHPLWSSNFTIKLQICTYYFIHLHQLLMIKENDQISQKSSQLGHMIVRLWGESVSRQRHEVLFAEVDQKEVESLQRLNSIIGPFISLSSMCISRWNSEITMKDLPNIIARWRAN